MTMIMNKIENEDDSVDDADYCVVRRKQTLIYYNSKENYLTCMELN